MTAKKSVYALYKTKDEVEHAIRLLEQDGFRRSDVSVLIQEKGDSHNFGHTKSSKAPEGTAVGAGSGAVLGGALGILAGLGALTIPGIGPLIAAGPIMTGLAGLGVGSAVGGLGGALIGMGVPEYEAKRYEGNFNDGGTLISVEADSSPRVDKAKAILRQSGGQDISVSKEGKSESVDKVGWATSKSFSDNSANKPVSTIY